MINVSIRTWFHIHMIKMIRSWLSFCKSTVWLDIKRSNKWIWLKSMVRYCRLHNAWNNSFSYIVNGYITKKSRQHLLWDMTAFSAGIQTVFSWCVRAQHVPTKYPKEHCTTSLNRWLNAGWIHGFLLFTPNSDQQQTWRFVRTGAAFEIFSPVSVSQE